MRVLAHVVLNAFGLWLISHLPGIHWQGGLVALLLAGVVLGLLNLFVKPVITFLSCPFLVLTLGLFYLVINGAVLYLAAFFLDGLAIDGFGWAIVGGLVLSVLNLLVKPFTRERTEKTA